MQDTGRVPLRYCSLTHWTGRQGRMQPLLTGARKTVLVKATNDNYDYFVISIVT